MSTDDQAESGLGLDAQRATIMAAAAGFGLALRDVVVDAGVSGARPLADRPALLNAVGALRRGDVVLVAKRDRLGRDAIEVGLIERAIAKRGARILSAANEGNGDAPADIYMRRQMDLFAEYELLMIRARTKAALAAKKARNERTGTLPFGEQLAADGVHREPAPVEQRIRARIDQLAAEHRSTRSIAAALNAEGWTTRKGTAWRFQYVAQALKRTS